MEAHLLGLDWTGLDGRRQPPWKPPKERRESGVLYSKEEDGRTCDFGAVQRVPTTENRITVQDRTASVRLLTVQVQLYNCTAARILL